MMHPRDRQKIRRSRRLHLNATKQHQDSDYRWWRDPRATDLRPTSPTTF
jgi:hypothetical protein